MENLTLLVQMVEEGKPTKEDITQLVKCIENYKNRGLLRYDVYKLLLNRYSDWETTDD